MDGKTEKTLADMVEVQTAGPQCRLCPHLALEVDDLKMWAGDLMVDREIILTCRHERACRYAMRTAKK